MDIGEPQPKFFTSEFLNNSATDHMRAEWKSVFVFHLVIEPKLSQSVCVRRVCTGTYICSVGM